MSTHHFDIRVYYEDTDAAGIVYHANYLKFAERARVEYLRQTAWQPSNMNQVFAVVAVNVQYRSPALTDDQLTVISQIVRIGNSSMDVKQQITRGEEVMCELLVTLVCIDSQHQPISIPADVRQLKTD